MIARFLCDLRFFSLQPSSPNDYLLSSNNRWNRFWSHYIGMDRDESTFEVALDSVDTDDVRVC